jgi:hypothetical protein
MVVRRKVIKLAEKFIKENKEFLKKLAEEDKYLKK